MLKVIALGNALRGDDSIGPYVVEKLSTENIPVPLTLIDAGSDAFTLLDHLTGQDPVMIIDCARMGRTPGEVVRFDIRDAHINQADVFVSLHGFGFSEVYAMASKLGPVAPCSIIGVEPKSLIFGEGLSEEVKQSIPSIIHMVIEEAKKYAE